MGDEFQLLGELSSTFKVVIHLNKVSTQKADQSLHQLQKEFSLSKDIEVFLDQKGISLFIFRDFRILSFVISFSFFSGRLIYSYSFLTDPSPPFPKKGLRVRQTTDYVLLFNERGIRILQALITFLAYLQYLSPGIFHSIPVGGGYMCEHTYQRCALYF